MTTSTQTQFILRPYQKEAVDIGIDFLRNNKKQDYHGFMIIPSGAGKSLIIANIAKELDEPTLILQPSKEILVQNYQKLRSYGYSAGIYSASAGYKFIEHITYATILSIVNKPHLFRHFKYLIIDECDAVHARAENSSYTRFIRSLDGIKLCGFTATPYRLTAGFGGGMLKFINRTNPRIFNKCIYYIQNRTLFDEGHLCKLEYYSFNIIDRTMLSMNKSGTDFSEDSLRAYYRKINMPQITVHYGNRLMAKRKNMLIFCSLIAEAYEVSRGIPGSVVVTGEMPGKDRDRILTQFKDGTISCLINVGVVAIGFDKPDLECILIGRSTMSLRLWYQWVGRGMRPHPLKESCWICDLGGNINFFGKIETMEIVEDRKGLLSVWNNGRQLTQVFFQKN